MARLHAQFTELVPDDYAVTSPEPDFDDNQRTIFDNRYSRKDEDGNPSELPQEAIWRKAINVSAVEALYAGERKLGTKSPSKARRVDPKHVEFPFRTAVRKYNWLVGNKLITNSFERVMMAGMEAWLEKAKQFQTLVTRLDYLGNSPTWTGAGTNLGQLAACFVLPIADDLGRRRDSIYETLKVAVLIQQTGGGNGFPLYDIRPEGALVYRSMGKASGAMSFLRVYNAAFIEMAQGGTRRGANMGVMLVSHPEIRPFMNAKTEEGKIKEFNLSVAITDDFMQSVEEDADFNLEFDGKVYETVKARELYEEIIQKAWIMGDPGNLFIDRANRDNPNPRRYRLKATNPCGEQWLGEYENCCLGSIHIGNFANWDGTFDWERFREAVVLSTEFLDDVVDANAYVPEVPELEAAAEGGRRIGLGLMGLADALAKVGLGYNTPEGREFSAQVTEFARYHCMLTSIERAEERGPFHWIKDSIYDPDLLKEFGPGAEYAGITEQGEPFTHKLWQPPQPLVQFERDFGRPELDWDLVTQGIIQHGIRNCCQFTFAPTGTISNVAGCEGSGCEPFFALRFIRTMMQEAENIELPYLSSLFEESLRRHGVSDEDREQILAELAEAPNGSCQEIELVPEAVKQAFVVAADISAEAHVRMQASLQAFVDNSISKTINMPNEATPEDVSTAYKLAYELGCKGITIYRQGSRQLEVLSTKSASKTGEVEVVDEEHWPIIRPMAIPRQAEKEGLPARVFPVMTPFGKMQVTITEHPDHPGRPFDTRITFGKAGNDKAADTEALGRMISLLFRSGVAVEDIVDQLKGLGGFTQYGLGERKVLSAPDGLSKLLERKYIDVDADVSELEDAAADPPAEGGNGKVLGTEICPKCHRGTVVFADGCLHCEIRLGGCGEYNKCL
ncbi:MAG TPA: adenosylcobalamin-dependent ribonucleoside-diphosphate reductase [Candidatus Dormibacteraeota bacterium]|nr:adenosylcobalamin-dependent ribonucleoside-diphosphate reductase [Candidatus Dormibacteraeota bacterium]